MQRSIYPIILVISLHQKAGYISFSSQLKINGEARSADINAASKFVPIFTKYIADNDLVPDQIYNASETAFYIRMLQDKTPSVNSDIHRHDNCIQSRDHVTFLLDMNKTGSQKLNLKTTKLTYFFKK